LKQAIKLLRQYIGCICVLQHPGTPNHHGIITGSCSSGITAAGQQLVSPLSNKGAQAVQQIKWLWTNLISLQQGCSKLGGRYTNP
jgi:hypothetical protein